MKSIKTSENLSWNLFGSKNRGLLKNLFQTFILLGLSVFSSCTDTMPEQKNDISEIEKVMQEYRQAWKEGDSIAVLDKLSSKIILFQVGKNSKPIVTKNSVSKFWFPKSDLSCPIIKYEIENEEIESSRNLAYYLGVSKLTWCTFEKEVARDTVLSVSEFTTILKKEGTEWKIYRIMFNLKNSEYSRN